MIAYLQMLETSEEKARFEELVHTYKNLMFYAANQILNNEHDAEDSVQQAFFAILKNFDKISQIQCPQTRAFVVIVVERKAIDLYRARSRRSVVAFDEEFMQADTGTEEAAAVRTDLARALAQLPARARELLLLKYDSGYSEGEIAAICSMTPGNVKKTIYRAKKKLEMLLERRA